MYFNEMANHLLNHRLTFFIGAGFSRVFDYPSWTKLLLDIIEDETYKIKEQLIDTNLFYFVDEDKYTDGRKINDEILKKLIGVDYLRLAGYIDYLLKTYHQTDIHEAVIKMILDYEDKRVLTNDVTVISEFMIENKEYLEDIITTNYDTNIEYCFKNDIAVINRNLASLDKVTGKNRVYKIHGCITDYKRDRRHFDSNFDNEETNIVITEKDYNGFNYNNKYLFYKLYSFFTEKKIVFIGYSINDPNIRFLLNQVIEENNEKVGLDIYWVNRDELNVLDKLYYEEQFKLKIIENFEIKDFFITLNERKNQAIELREISKLDDEEYFEEFIYHYNERQYLENAIEDNKLSGVLSYLYSEVINHEYVYDIERYLHILVNSPDEIINELKHQLDDLFSSKSRISMYVIDFIYDDDNVLNFIRKHHYIDCVLSSYGEFSSGSHPFGEYASCIESTCKAFSIFQGEMSSLHKILLDGLVRNIMKSCSDDSKVYGYDWRGLRKVKEYISLLSSQNVRRLIKDFVSGYYDSMGELQLKYIINNSKLQDKTKKKFIYNYILKDEMKFEIRKIFRANLKTVLGKNNNYERISSYNYKLDEYEYLLSEYIEGSDIIFELKSLYDDDVVIEVIQSFNYTSSKIELEIDGKSMYFKSRKEINAYYEKLSNQIELYLDMSLISF